MFIRQIHLTNFRNYGRLDLEVGPSVNIIYGDNAQGKTNLIEAISVCSSVSSHKPVKDKEMILFGDNEYEVKMDLTDDDGSNSEMCVRFISETSDFAPNGIAKRVLLIDGMQIKKISEYIGICNTVIFAPEDLNIVKGSPSARRKFLNYVITKVSPSYINLLGNISKLMNQKNTFLKKIKFANSSDSHDAELDFWDFSIADLSAEIIIYRYRFSKLLSEKANKQHSFISGGKEELILSYSTISGCIEALEAFLEDNNIVDEFMSRSLSGAKYGELKACLSKIILSKIKATRKSDIEKGIMSVGINKDDFEMSINGKPVRKYSSQGQQRSAALALKLSELEIIRQFVSSTPILLLDDVFSELDQNRRVALISAMTDAQIFITCTDRGYIEKELSSFSCDISKTKYFHVTNGSITVED